MTPNFTDCGARFEQCIDDGSCLQWQYNGTPRGILGGVDNPPALITVDGCLALCGAGPQYYDWSEASATISTWVLPVIGLLLQAPFESNAFVPTLFALARWVGSPVASLAYVLWNIKSVGKCALMVDMAVPFDDLPGPDSQFEQIRDSFYLLSVMNQYSVKKHMPVVEAEKLLRIALFSDSLQLEVDEDESRSLIKRRRKLANAVREGRKKGTVPVFISLMWFLFSLVVSIQAAFGSLGENATAHNLAMGLLLCWLPTLILATIVDRNPGSPVTVGSKLNKFVDAVRRALLNPRLRATYIRDVGRPLEDFQWTAVLDNDEYFRGDFFTGFAGQGRVRWHYGVAQPILAGIEESFVAEKGRDWLETTTGGREGAEAARTLLVKGPPALRGLNRFDPLELWQMLGAFLIVAFSITGAFTISYWTPTVGLGCRSGSMVIFASLANGICGLELLAWWLVPDDETSPATDTAVVIVDSHDPVARLGRLVDRRLSSAAGRAHRRPSTLFFHRLLGPPVHRFVVWWGALGRRRRLEVLLLRPLEILSSIWLLYFALAQTFGWLNECHCICSVWGFHGGYMDFETQEYYRANGVKYYWGVGTALSLASLSFAFAFIITEWCVQSHLSTYNYDAALHGLMVTRRFKRYTAPFREVPNHVIKGVRLTWRRCLVAIGTSRGGSGGIIARRASRIKRGRRSLVWAVGDRDATRRNDSDSPRAGLLAGAAGMGGTGPQLPLARAAAETAAPGGERGTESEDPERSMSGSTAAGDGDGSGSYPLLPAHRQQQQQQRQQRHRHQYEYQHQQYRPHDDAQGRRRLYSDEEIGVPLHTLSSAEGRAGGSSTAPEHRDAPERGFPPAYDPVAYRDDRYFGPRDGV